MRIAQSEITLLANHQAAGTYEIEMKSVLGFDQVLGTVENKMSEAEMSATKEQKLRLRLETLLARLLEIITGAREKAANPAGEMVARAQPSADTPQVWRWHNEVTERIHESEATEFAAQGVIRKADGKSVEFSMALRMCREFSCERTRSTTERVALRDPLVINFEGTAARLSGARFVYDVDADGTPESLPALAEGSGFLAVDNNSDGVINDGSELFGAQSGDGFHDLKAYDTDANHWLDEADTGFAALRVWQIKADGEVNLFTLAEKGIGALYLGSVDTPFSLKDAENNMLAAIRASGVYLTEAGTAGSLQQVDLGALPALAP